MQTKSETKAFYDKIAKVYDLLAEHSERPLREAGLRLLAAAPGEQLLEIGFGTGHILVELARPSDQREGSSASTSRRTCWPTPKTF